MSRSDRRDLHGIDVGLKLTRRNVSEDYADARACVSVRERYTARTLYTRSREV